MKKGYIFILTTLLLFSCSENESTNINNEENEVIEESMSFTTLTSEETGIDFTNSITETDSLNYFKYEYMYNGGGVSVGDINNDGLTDIYFTGNQVSDKLYLNKGDLKFEDITDKAIGDKAAEGWHTGVSMVDVNQDGWLDIYVCRSGMPNDARNLSNLLFINNGDNTFSEKGAEYGVDIQRHTTQSVFFDYDNDGDLDLYVMNHLNPDKSKAELKLSEINALIEVGSPESDVFLENVGGEYVDVSKKVGISNHANGLGITVSDVNNDGFQDVYVSNDFIAMDNFYINNGDGTFSDKGKEYIKHTSYFSMGNDISDFNNDGLLDIITLDMASEDHVRSKKNMGGMNTAKFWESVKVGYHYQYMFNSLQMNNGNNSYSDVALISGVSKTDWSWAPLFVDFNNDGLKDLFITNGYHKDVRDNDYLNQTAGEGYENKKLSAKLELIPSGKITNYIFENTGDLSFEKRMNEWNVDVPVNSNGVAYADFDNDGDLDLVLNNMDEKSTILENKLMTNNHFVRLKIMKDGVVALGVKVKLFTRAGIQYQELQVTRGYQSSVESVLHFGISAEDEVERVEIEWLDGMVSLIDNVTLNQIHIVDYEKISKMPSISKNGGVGFFEEVKGKIKFKHNEQFVNDFELEVLLPNKMSQLGPFMSKGDVDGDGLEDFYISGSRGYSGELFLQNKDGSFIKKSGPWNLQKEREEMGSEFFDVDNDGDLDLYVISGGNEFNIESNLFYDQLYINNGNGDFINESNRLPIMQASGQRLTTGDYDGDGDLDVFIGGRQISGRYPFVPWSYLLNNEDGVFSFDTNIPDDLSGVGMVTQPIFDDFDQDGDLDLICVGEWMPISFFENNNGLFTNVTSKYGLSDEVGWWMSITVGDFNGDGKNDYVIGNTGENNKFHPSKEHPLEIYCSDFDESGSYDIVLGKYQNNVCYPVRGKQCSSEQMPFVSQKFPTYNDFAIADLNKIYGKDKLDKALHYSATSFSSVILLSNQSGFSVKRLPSYAQISPINAGVALDINKDGFLDFVGIGNNYGAEVETVRYDAGIGVVLIGDGKGSFTAIRPEFSGLVSELDDKDILMIRNFLIVSSNNSKIRQYQF